MAGWDHDFDIDVRDVDVLLGCLRILRRTCARYRIEFTYYVDRNHKLAHGRRRYMLVYDLQSAQAPLAVAEFIVEMRAVSTLYRDRRQRRLPLRLMRDVAWVCVPEAVHDQIDSRRVPDSVRPDVAAVLVRYQIAYSAFARGELAAADFLDSQHSLVTDLALVLGRAASPQDKFPTLVRKLTTDVDLVDGLIRIGGWRNRVKHRGERDLAVQVVDEGAGIIWYAVARLTGAYVDPVSAAIREIESNPHTAFRLPPMFTREGTPRSPRR